MDRLEVIFQKGCAHETVGVCALETALFDCGNRVSAGFTPSYGDTLIFLLENRQRVNGF